MHRSFLGDSYDIVKRLWQEIFAGWAPLYAEPRFIPAELREDFFRLTKIPLFSTETPSAFSLFNDPDTGIQVSSKPKRGRSHITIEAIVGQLQQLKPQCVVTFDRSISRNRPVETQLREKLKRLSLFGATGFYYRSHAPFLFAFAAPATMQAAMRRLRDTGIPKDRLEEFDSSIEASGNMPTV